MNPSTYEIPPKYTKIVPQSHVSFIEGELPLIEVSDTEINAARIDSSKNATLTSETIPNHWKEVYSNINMKFKELNPCLNIEYQIYGKFSNDQTVWRKDDQFSLNMRRNILPTYKITVYRCSGQEEFFCKVKGYNNSTYYTYKFDFEYNKIKFRVYLFRHHRTPITDSTPLPNGKSYRWVHSYNPGSINPYSHDIYTIKSGMGSDVSPVTTIRSFNRLSSLFKSDKKPMRQNSIHCTPPELKIGELKSTCYENSRGTPYARIILNENLVPKSDDNDFTSVQLHYILLSMVSVLKYEDDFRSGNGKIKEFPSYECSGSSG